MPSFTVNTSRFDPYRNYFFRVKWDNRYVAGVSHVSGLTQSVQVITHRDGGDPVPRKLHGQVDFSAVTLARGVTHDSAFQDWAMKVFSTARASSPVQAGQGARPTSGGDFRKQMRIELFNESGQLVKAWNLFRCWVSTYSALPELDANGNGVAIESITIQNEGWVQDTAVIEPKEPTLA